jgi:Mg-chelatase subunit ChlD
MLIVLDRTLTMHATPAGETPTDAPEYKSSKWYQAVTAIEQMVTPPADATVRFGLELWPKDPGGGACVTLAEQVTKSKKATNPACEPGEITIPTGLNRGAQIQSLLDPASTTLCFSTPTGQALITAKDHLKQNSEEGRDQYVVLVTDGADWANTCPDPDPLLEVQKLRAEGIKTFIVGFSSSGASTSGVGLEFLNNLACAGGTAKGFPGPCKDDGQGNLTAIDPKVPPLFLQADSGAQLTAALQSVAGSLCCGCQVQCDAPEVLFALDRTLTMARTPDGDIPTDAPDYASSKWYQALNGIKQVVSAQEKQFRFGLELWPRDPGGEACVTLAEQVTKSKKATNPACEPGEVVVPPILNASSQIASKLDPKTTRLCFSTPTGEALITASTYLTGNLTPGRAQYVVLVTDGVDWANTCPDPDPLLRVQQLAASGIKTFTVGFFGKSASPSGVGLAFLNDMACAGQTAINFATACKQGPTGYIAADPNSTVPLYLGAENSAQLEGVLVKALGDLGCKLLTGLTRGPCHDHRRGACSYVSDPASLLAQHHCRNRRAGFSIGGSGTDAAEFTVDPWRGPKRPNPCQRRQGFGSTPQGQLRAQVLLRSRRDRGPRGHRQPASLPWASRPQGTRW